SEVELRLRAEPLSVCRANRSRFLPRCKHTWHLARHVRILVAIHAERQLNALFREALGGRIAQTSLRHPRLALVLDVIWMLFEAFLHDGRTVPSLDEDHACGASIYAPRRAKRLHRRCHSPLLFSGRS